MEYSICLLYTSNLRVIHNADYYQNNNLIDLHNINDKNMVIQHITLESFINEKNTIRCV